MGQDRVLEQVPAISEKLPTISMSAFAQRRKLSYTQALRLVLIGEVRGWKDEAGRWQVAEADA
jgi:hypothetical protein